MHEGGRNGVDVGGRQDALPFGHSSEDNCTYPVYGNGLFGGPWPALPYLQQLLYMRCVIVVVLFDFQLEASHSY